MPIVAGDMSIDRQTKVIDYIGDDHGGTAPSYYTWIEFHRWVQSLADDPTSSGNDEMDSTDVLPSTRATDNFITLVNGYSITAAVVEHGYDGSIVWDSGNEIADGFVNYGNQGVVIQLQQNGVILTDDYWNFNVGGADDTSSGAAFLTDSGEAWTTDQWVGYVIENVTDGSQALITSNTGTTILGTLRGGTNNNWDSGDTYLISQGLNADSAQGISHRFTLQTRTGGADIDGTRVLGKNRTYLRTFGEFPVNGTARGNNVLALSDAGDLNNTTSHATIDAISDAYITRTTSTATVSGVNSTGQNILNVSDGTQFTDGDFIMTAVDNHEYKITSISVNALTLNRNLVNATAGGEAIYDLAVGFAQVDVNNDSTAEDYMMEWDRGANAINLFWEYGKYLSADYTDHYIYGLPGDLFRGITHEFSADARTGTFDAVEGVSWTAGSGGSAGTGQMLAIDSPTAGTAMWIQLLTGGAPGDNAVVTGDNSGATFTLDAAATDRVSLLKDVFIGDSTGSSIVGQYGLTLETTDLSASDRVFDLTNTQIIPPNNVTGTVKSLDITGGSEEDHVSVMQYFGTSDANGDPSRGKYRWTLAVELNAANETVVDIGVDATGQPATGYIQVVDNAGATRRLAYTGTSGNTFTGITGAVVGDEDFDVTAAAVGNEVFQAEYMLDTALTTDNITSVVIDGTIDSDTPTSGPLRVQDNDGRLRLLNYSSRTGSTFTVDTTDGEEDFATVNASLGSQVIIGYLDQDAVTTDESFSYVYGSGDKQFVASVRNGKTNPIKEYIATFTVGTNGGETTAIRTTDA
jgi:hypothetical protein